MRTLAWAAKPVYHTTNDAPCRSPEKRGIMDGNSSNVFNGFALSRHEQTALSNGRLLLHRRARSRRAFMTSGVRGSP
jgi:hypothetical protein